VSLKYGFIHGEEGNFPLERMCTWARVSRSGYYTWRGRRWASAAGQPRRRSPSPWVDGKEDHVRLTTSGRW